MRLILRSIGALTLALPIALQAAVIVNLNPSTASYNGGVVDDGGVTGSQSGIGFATTGNGLTFNIEFSPAADDLSGTVLLVEIGGTANGTGLYLVDGVPTFVSKQGSGDVRVPEFALPTPDLDFADQAGGVNSIGVVAAQSDFGVLSAGQTYTVALTWDQATRFQLGVESDGAVTTNNFTVTRTIGNWAGNSTLSVGSFSSKGNVGGLAGANASNNLGAPWDVDLAKPFAGTILRALYWNARASLTAVTNLAPWEVNLTVMASSAIPGWPATNAIDGNPGTVWSSSGHGAVSDAVEWLMVDYGQVIPMTGVSITPRPGGGCWPADYRIEYSTDGFTWSTVPGMDFTDQTAPPGTLSLAFGNSIIARGLRLYATRLSSDGSNYYLQIAEFKALGVERWASPAELRGKKVIGAGQYTAINPDDPDAPTPKFLANNPDYLANHPFDGISIQVPVDLAWCTNQGLISQSAYGLNQLTMTRLAIPYSAVQAAVADLQRVSWGHLTDNFLWYGLWDASQWGDNDTRYPVDPASASDWTNVTRNAALCARICREANLKGFTMDTEQYSNYESGEPYPFGKGTPEVWRQRGQQWIQAVQAEFPAIKIILFFSWGPESEGAWPGYENLKYFMNGILASVQAPARLIHGWESTFWYGGSLAENGNITPLHSGDRAAYAATRNDIRNVWRNYSDNPSRYDQFVDVGMAAWVESDPYNLTPGWPSGFLSRPPWSNLPYALAYSDSYVWVWSERTSYPRTKEILNPFLASIANQTFNTGQEPAKSFTETFQTDPLKRGWYFDFDLLSIGREVNPGFLPAMNPDSVAYNWDPTNRAVRVRSAWTSGLYGERTGAFAWQRRRYAHPVQSLTRSNSFHAEFDFQVESFGTDPANPILIGMFNTGSLVTTQSITLRMDGPTTAAVTVVGDGLPWATTMSLSHALATTRTYRISFAYNGTTASLRALLTDTSDSSVVGQVSGTVPASVGQFQLDEAGIAQWDATFTSTATEQAYQYLLKRAVLYPPAPVLSLVSSQPLRTNGFQFALQGLPGQTYQIETSTNLANWSVIGSVLATNTPVLFLDAAATNTTHRFYRAGTTAP
ncbi:MAG: discoidin domain-containing protein [Verrucomicrobiota bacterium]